MENLEKTQTLKDKYINASGKFYVEDNKDEIFIQGKRVDLDKTDVGTLEIYLQNIQKEKEVKKAELDELLEEIYN